MTDTEIIKALECCFMEQQCNNCPLYKEHSADCLDTVLENAHALITRQQSKIDKLKTELKTMREILFRGKRTDNGEWVFGRQLADDVIVPIGQPFEFEINTGFIRSDLKCYEVDSDTVGQYTGLTDNNGKKIFEGDIIKWGLKPCVVKWDEYNASFCLYVYGTIKISGFNRDTMKLKEVIGNIYDNPEIIRR